MGTTAHFAPTRIGISLDQMRPFISAATLAVPLAQAMVLWAIACDAQLHLSPAAVPPLSVALARPARLQLASQRSSGWQLLNLLLALLRLPMHASVDD